MIKIPLCKFVQTLLSCLVLTACTSFYPVSDQAAVSLEEARDKYEVEYLAPAVDWPNWKGNIDKCNSGDIPNKVRKKALLRINYFRTICGLYPVEFKEEYNQLAQQAAFIIAANGRLSHYPDKTWKCYNNGVAEACQRSSLQYSRTGLFSEGFISGFMEDLGDSNKGVPHRRSLLNSRAFLKGYGSTGYAEAIYNTIKTKKENESIKLPEFIAYPIAGYNEIGLVYPRWSFGIPDKHEVDFSQVKVMLMDQEGNNLQTNILPYQDIYDPTIVWDLKDKIKKQDLLKKEITVLVKNVLVDGELRDYNYVVKFFDYPDPEGEE